ncbi:MAG: cytochrome P450 [Campylobacterales bacterium]|nr:cytochrome P450 [Campylobacterales bacterium]
MIDFSSEAFLNNPYPFYKHLRELNEPYFLPQDPNMPTSSKGMWLISNYNNAKEVLKNASDISNNMLKILPDIPTKPFFTHLLNRDGSDHKRLRNLTNDFFSPHYIKSIEGHIEAVIDGLIDKLKAQEETELVHDFTTIIPMEVIACVIGIPSSDMHRVREWTIAIGDGFDTLLASQEVIAKQQKALSEFLEYMRDLLTKSEMIEEHTILHSFTVANKQGLISDDEILGMIGFLLVSGHETTINLIGNGIYLLLSHPQQFELLKNDLSLLPNAIEEILRFESPLQRSSFRITTKPIKIQGRQFEANEQLSVVIASANRDESIFENPDQFDITRLKNPHLAFGYGTHNCIGQHLARTEGLIAFRKLIEAFPNMQLIDEKPHWRKNSFGRGLDSLSIKL